MKNKRKNVREVGTSEHCWWKYKVAQLISEAGETMLLKQHCNSSKNKKQNCHMHLVISF